MLRTCESTLELSKQYTLKKLFTGSGTTRIIDVPWGYQKLTSPQIKRIRLAPIILLL
jgi:hypothetical protein